ncbi:MAG: carboxypeptidase regulatory-like domain-containing protein, partial [Imperialibacter sp.]
MNYNFSLLHLRSVFTLVLFFVVTTHGLFAQGGKKVNVKGKVVDSQSGEAMSFASIRIFAQDDQFIGGNVTDDKGNFTVEVPAGNYYALVEFMGYEAHRTGSFQASSNTDIGTVQLSASSSTLEEVEVRAEKSTMELSLDKKIFNVGQDLANAGGTASDLLTNIPSIAVDPEGNVKLRGSDNVMILIDGKPSGLVSLKGASGLQQMQA